MRGKFIGAALAATLVASSAGAATLDFLAEASGNERGVADNTTIVMDGVNVTFSAEANNNPAGASAYFDQGGGLGVCKVLTNPGAQCDPSSDDNVTVTELVTIAFDSLQKLSGLAFANAAHKAVVATNTLLFGYDKEPLQRFTFAELAGMTFDGIMSASFAFDALPYSAGAVDRGLAASAEQFYITSATVVSTTNVIPPVPLPAGLPLMLAGLGLFGLGARLKSKRSA